MKRDEKRENELLEQLKSDFFLATDLDIYPSLEIEFEITDCDTAHLYVEITIKFQFKGYVVITMRIGVDDKQTSMEVGNNERWNEWSPTEQGECLDLMTALFFAAAFDKYETS